MSEAGPPPDNWRAYQIVRDRLGINWKIVLLPSTLGDQDTKINAAAAANNLPDLFQVNRDAWYKLAKAGLLAPVDSLLNAMPVRTTTHYDDVVARKMVTLNKVMYGLPEPGQMPMTDGFVVRKDWLDKLGLKEPKNLDEFMTVAKAFTERDPDGNGKADTYGFGAYLESSGLQQAGLGLRFEWVFGAYGVAGTWNTQDAKSFGLNARKPEFLKALQFIKGMVDAKIMDPDWNVLKKDEYRARWKQGRWGMMHENFAALSTVANYKDFDKNFPNGLWVAPPPPVGPDGKSCENVLLKNVRVQAISQRAAKAGKLGAIAKLLEWMAHDEGYILLGFGYEGEHFKRDKNGKHHRRGHPGGQAVDRQGPAAVHAAAQPRVHQHGRRAEGALRALHDQQRQAAGPARVLERVPQLPVHGLDGRGDHQPARERGGLRALLQRERDEVRRRPAAPGREDVG